MKRISQIIIICSCFLVSTVNFVYGQAKRILFLGNSYTYTNNLPQLLADVASSAGDSLIFDSYTPGGFQLSQHAVDLHSINKIWHRYWDYVALQEQSPLLSRPDAEVASGVFPYVQKLDSIAHNKHSCPQTVFFMTWGYKNGDAYNCTACPSWPYVCTYEGMDSLLNLRYRMLADSLKALVSPVGAVWHYIRQYYPQIELYQLDESHPSLAGSYAAACSFYSTCFRKDPTLISFNPGLPVPDAAAIREAAKLVVYDSLLNWNIGEYDSVLHYGCQGPDTIIVDPMEWSVNPNPATESITVIYPLTSHHEIVQIFNSTASLVKEVKIPTPGQINMQDMRNGMYFVRIKYHLYVPVKIIKQ